MTGQVSVRYNVRIMNTKTTLTITEARKNIFDVAKNIQKPGTYYTLTEKGHPKAVIMSAEEFESWQETLEVIRDFPELNKNVTETDKAVKSGGYKKWATLSDLKKERNITLANKQKKKYGVHSSCKTKSSKKYR